MANRLAVVLSHPIQYYSPWFRWIRSRTQVEFRVFYLWDFGLARRHDPHFGTSFEWDVDLLSGCESEFVPNSAKRPGAEHFLGFNNPDITKRLSDWRPQAVLLFGYKWATHLRVIAWATTHRIPLMFRGDSHLLGRNVPPFRVRVALRMLYSRFASFLCVGAANRQYFEAFGVPSRKIFFAPHSVDATLFDGGDGAHHEAARQLRAKLGIRADTTVVLFAGKLVAAKQPRELLEAFQRLNIDNSALVFVGDGAEKEKIQIIASEYVGNAKVYFLPFANQTEMPSRYLLADLFVLPSRGLYETWGLAVNEAMHMGIPCMVSNLVGCQRDLVTHGTTGWVFDPVKEDSLAAVLSEAIGDLRSDSRRLAIVDAVKARISGYTFEKTTEGLLAALASLHS
jgi:glycosyltransferase involved in cell wall biosynthesis